MQRRFDRILEAEQAAAAVVARRTTDLRDRLIDAEGSSGTILVVTRSGDRLQGTLEAVCSDHVELIRSHRPLLILFDEIAMVEL